MNICHYTAFLFFVSIVSIICGFIITLLITNPLYCEMPKLGIQLTNNASQYVCNYSFETCDKIMCSMYNESYKITTISFIDKCKCDSLGLGGHIFTCILITFFYLSMVSLLIIMSLFERQNLNLSITKIVTIILSQIFFISSGIFVSTNINLNRYRTLNNHKSVWTGSGEIYCKGSQCFNEMCMLANDNKIIFLEMKDNLCGIQKFAFFEIIMSTTCCFIGCLIILCNLDNFSIKKSQSMNDRNIK